MIESSDEHRQPDGNLVRLLIGQERIEGKIDRMGDQVVANSQRLEALLDVVTGSKSGAHTGLVVRTHDLESAQRRTDERVNNLEKAQEARDARLEAMDGKLDKVIKFQEDHPPFLYLIRFRTSATVRTLLIVLAILVILWTTGALERVLGLFGL